MYFLQSTDLVAYGAGFGGGSVLPIQVLLHFQTTQKRLSTKIGKDVLFCFVLFQTKNSTEKIECLWENYSASLTTTTYNDNENKDHDNKDDDKNNNKEDDTKDNKNNGNKDEDNKIQKKQRQ